MVIRYDGSFAATGTSQREVLNYSMLDAERPYGYGLVFALAVSLHVVAFATICLAIPGIRPLEGAKHDR
jgi:hypothetical protein